MTQAALRAELEGLYARYHRPEYLGSDPLNWPHRYREADDREAVAFLAATFAFGNVKSINAAVEEVLGPLGARPASFLREAGPASLARLYGRFSYRWVRGPDLRVLLGWVAAALGRHGSLGELWRSVDDPGEPTTVPAMERFIAALTSFDPGCRERSRLMRRAGKPAVRLAPVPRVLLPCPSGGSACKRMNLFLRWVARPADGVDLGLWPHVSTSRLVMPVDTHIHRVATGYAWISRRGADMAAAIEITAALRRIRPDDPCRYDFALTRGGILGEVARRG